MEGLKGPRRDTALGIQTCMGAGSDMEADKPTSRLFGERGL